MDLDLILDIPYTKFKILSINVFSILYKAATLNIFKLGVDLHYINQVLKESCSHTILSRIHIILISMLLISKFIMGYISLATNIMAMFPILIDESPELLLPTIVAQTVEHLLLGSAELLLGYVTVCYYIPCKAPFFTLFVVKMFVRISLSISTLNTYSDLYSHLKFPTIFDASGTSALSPDISAETIEEEQPSIVILEESEA